MEGRTEIIKSRLNSLMDQLQGTGLWPEQSKIRLSQPQQMCMVDSYDGWFCTGGLLMDGSLDIVMNFPSYFKI